MQLFPTILPTFHRACAIGVIVLGSQALAQSSHDDGHEHETTAPAQEQEQASDGIINTMCPVTTDEEVDPMFTVEYEGQTIGLCCRKCRTRFEEDPEAYLAELPMLTTVSMTTSVDESSHDDSEEHGHNDEGGSQDEDEAHEHAESAMGDHDDGSAGDHDDSEPHDHATGHGQGESVLGKLIAYLGKFHPPTTHLPIGMLIGGAIAEGLFILTKRDLFRNAGTFCVVLAGFGALAAVTLGWFNGGFTLVDDEWVQTVHRWLGTSTTVVTLLALGLLIRTSKAGAAASTRLHYRAALFAAAGLVGATGFFGGALIYGINHYAW